MVEENTNPKTFISYSWSSPAHQKFVIDLAEKLTTDGVAVIIDKWDLKEGQDKYAFMEKMVTDPTMNKVLIISDKKYAEKSDNKFGGVGTESQIISAEIYDKVEQTKFIPIVTEFDNNGNPYLPVFLKNRIYINFGEDSVFYDEYDKLLRNIYDKPIFKKPALGSIPSYILQEKQQTLITQHKYGSLRDAISKEKTISKMLCSEYLDEFISALQTFRLPEKDSEKQLDDQVIDAIRSIKVYRDQLVEFYKLLITGTNDFSYYEIIFEFLEKVMRLNYSPEGIGSFSEWWFEQYRFFNMENFLYLTALLIKYKKIDEVKFFTEEKYYVYSGYERGAYEFSLFNSYIKSIEQHRKSRLKSNRISITADLLKERCDITFLSFEEIMQADFILSLKSTFDKDNKYSYWFPRTLVYKGWHSQLPFPIFIKAESERYFNTIGKLFNVRNREELMQKFNKASEVFEFSNWRFDYQSIPFTAFLNLDKLYKS